MKKSELIRALQAEVEKHSWPEYPAVNGIVHTSCGCGAEIRTATAWLAHIRNEVLPAAVQRLSPEAADSESS